MSIEGVHQLHPWLVQRWPAGLCLDDQSAWLVSVVMSGGLVQPLALLENLPVACSSHASQRSWPTDVALGRSVTSYLHGHMLCKAWCSGSLPRGPCTVAHGPMHSDECAADGLQGPSWWDNAGHKAHIVDEVAEAAVDWPKGVTSLCQPPFHVGLDVQLRQPAKFYGYQNTCSDCVQYVGAGLLDLRSICCNECIGVGLPKHHEEG